MPTTQNEEREREKERTEDTMQQMNQCKQCTDLRVEPNERIDGDVEADPATLLCGMKNITRSTPFLTRKRLFMASLVLVMAIIGTLTAVLVTKAGDDNGGGRGETPDSGSRTKRRTQLKTKAPSTTPDCSDCKKEGYFCSLLEGNCSDKGQGRCIPKPEICTLDYTPVCGCDGVTYGNACSAAANGVSVDSQGECETVEASTTPDCSNCEEEGYFCSLPEGDCVDGGAGRCLPRPEMCTMDYTPVCGCDGVTYGNACSASGLGVSVEFQGECETVEPFTTPDCSDCKKEGFFCSLPEGDCADGGAGRCIPRPEICTMDYTPVCGCDGVTYGNACSAAGKGVSVDFQGECKTVELFTKPDCSHCEEEGYFCSLPEGSCADAGEGKCILKPEICTLDYTPVCGCDGVTYGNACSAAANGVSVEFQGECETVEPFTTPDCSNCEEEGYFCSLPEGGCADGGAGRCILKPEICTLDYTPVCGCDGVTYGNACSAAAKGVSIEFQGECETVELFTTTDCSDCEEEGYFCSLPEGNCADVGEGRCIPKPIMCTLDYTPVCGCDGITYGNACGAAGMGVSVEFQGECETVEPFPTRDCSDCEEEGYFCSLPEGYCADEGGGKCIPKPEICTMDYTPVCGCDGVTYGNACSAAAKGVSVEFQGECITAELFTMPDCSNCEEEGYFCSLPDGDCADVGAGRCIPKPKMCTLDYTPVCGCDGVTYGNSCGAAGMGVSVEFQGECETVEPFTTPDCSNCDEEGYFCSLPEGNCADAGEGRCIPKPKMCTLDYTPVCGCDGVTYGNACSAAGKGVSVEFQGECGTVEASMTPDCSNCEEEGYFCSLPEGNCADAGEGKCILKPEICTTDYTPVCGCDGVTYGNACSAAGKGVSVEFQGECDTVEPFTTSDCSNCEEEGYFCSLPEGDCADGGAGRCILKPEICTLDYTPVCGCDGVTYGNACSAAAKGVSVEFQGECETVELFTTTDCGADDVCVFPEGDCGVLLAGDCIPKPNFCKRMEAPVCGCDGVSYNNACIALSEGASIYAQGECVP